MDRTADGRPRFYGRRHGKRLSARRRRLLDEWLPALQIPEPAAGETIDPATLFDPAPRAVWLEIGFGGGEHLVAQALDHPDVGFLGVEPFTNGLAALLARMADAGLDRVRIFPDDARLLLPALKTAGIERLFVLFPDPWPKKRHWRRRFIGPDTLDDLARVLADGGELRTASDDPVMIRWILEQVRAHPAFTWTARGPADWRARPADAAPTRYEEKAIEEGRQPLYFSFRRRPRDSSAAP